MVSQPLARSTASIAPDLLSHSPSCLSACLVPFHFCSLFIVESGTAWRRQVRLRDARSLMLQTLSDSLRHNDCIKPTLGSRSLVLH